jgi:glutaminyl-tRNA synthetase
VKSTIHWVSAAHAIDAEVRLYEHLFADEDPEAAGDFPSCLNPDSIEVVPVAKVEPSLAGATPGSRYQFERLGYFCVDPDSTPERPVFDRTVTLRDTWAKIEKKIGG